MGFLVGLYLQRCSDKATNKGQGCFFILQSKSLEKGQGTIRCQPGCLFEHHERPAHPSLPPMSTQISLALQEEAAVFFTQCLLTHCPFLEDFKQAHKDKALQRVHDIINLKWR